MKDQSDTGHDGPYDAPVRIEGGRVLPEWIDYNGHMNVAYYTLAFDKAIDAFLERELGIGETFVAATATGPYALQSHYAYAAELLEGEPFSVTLRLLDHDAKRMHLFCQMEKPDGGALIASVETLVMNVDHVSKKGTPYPDWLHPRLTAMKAAHDQLPRPAQIGAALGIRRK